MVLYRLTVEMQALCVEVSPFQGGDLEGVLQEVYLNPTLQTIKKAQSNWAFF